MKITLFKVLFITLGLFIEQASLTAVSCTLCLPGQKSLAAKHYPQAMTEFTAAILANPKCIDARLGKAQVLSKVSNHPGAIKELNAVIAMQPKLSCAYVMRGVEFETMKEPNKVIRDASEAIVLDPKSAKAYALRARGYYMLVFTCFGQDQDLSRKGLADLDTAIRLDPKLAEAHFNKGVWLFGEKKPKEAIASLTKAIELDHSKPIYYDYRAVCYEDTGQCDKAIADLTVAIKLAPREIKAWNKRANAYIQKGDYNKALEDLNTAAQIAPKNFGIRRLKGDLLMKAKRFSEAVVEFKAIAAANSMDDEAYKSLGDAYYQLGKYQLSLQNYDEAIDLRSDSQSNYIARSKVYEKLGDRAKAQQDIKKANSCLGRPES